MSKDAKAVNYTAKNVEFMVATYALASTEDARKSAVKEIARELGKSAKSVIAKLARENVYIKAEVKTKTGVKAETKAAIVTDIAEALKLNAEDIASFANATKAALNAVRLALESTDEAEEV